MSFVRDLQSSSAKPPGGGSGCPDPTAALLNLSTVQSRMDKLHRFLSDSVNTNTLIGKEGMDMVSTEIASAVHQIIVNGAALLACTQSPCLEFRDVDLRSGSSGGVAGGREGKVVDPNVELVEDEDSEDYEIIELDAVEILAEHIHFCDICGKGFKRDANLRMHMRAHGNQFKTPEALAKPEKCVETVAALQGGGVVRKTRFSCPYVGCNRNKNHKKFRALKSAVCVKNHFKRSHCPKMYSCNRCNKKSFSVMADLKSHLKHCGETKWKCSCGTSFSRKEKLFGHMALFEGHMPAVIEEDEVIGKVTESTATATATAAMVEDDDDDEEEEEGELNPAGKQIDLRNEFPHLKDGFFDGLMFDGFDSIDKYCFQDLLGSPNQANKYSLGTGIDEFFNF